MIEKAVVMEVWHWFMSETCIRKQNISLACNETEKGGGDSINKLHWRPIAYCYVVCQPVLFFEHANNTKLNYMYTYLCSIYMYIGLGFAKFYSRDQYWLNVLQHNLSPLTLTSFAIPVIIPMVFWRSTNTEGLKVCNFPSTQVPKYIFSVKTGPKNPPSFKKCAKVHKFGKS